MKMISNKIFSCPPINAVVKGEKKNREKDTCDSTAKRVLDPPQNSKSLI